MKNLIYTDFVTHQAFMATAIVAGALGAVTGMGTVAFDLRSGSTEAATLKNVGTDPTDVEFVCMADATTTSVTFTLLESVDATITNARLANGTAVAGAVATITVANQDKAVILRVRLDRGTVTKQFIGISAEAVGGNAAAVSVSAHFHTNGSVPVTQPVAAVSVE